MPDSPARPRSPILIAALIILAAAPILFTIVTIAERGVNMPYGDEIDASAPIALRAARGEGVPLEWLFAPHNEHRIVTQRLVTILLAGLTRWNLIAESLMSVLAAAISLALVVATARRTGAPAWAILLPCAVLIFAPQQESNWLWGFQSVWFYTAMFSFGAVYLLTSPKRGWLALGGAVMCALGAQYSLAGGILAWGVGVIVMWINGWRRPLPYLIWIGIGALSTLLYFSGLPLTNARVPFDPGHMIRYLLSFTAGIFALPGDLSAADYRPLSAAAIALALINALIIRRFDGHWRAITIWLAAGLLALGMGWLTWFGRTSPLEIDPLRSPTTSRYFTFSVLFWAAFAGLAITAAHRIIRAAGARFTLPGAVVLASAAVGSIAAALFAISAVWQETIHPTREHEACLRAFILTDEIGCARVIHPAYFDPAWPYSDTQDFLRSLYYQLSEARLTPYAPETDGSFRFPLRGVAFEVIQTNTEVIFFERMIDQQTPSARREDVLSMYAPGMADFRVTLPARGGEIWLETAGYLGFVAEPDPNFPRDGVEFRAEVVQDGAIAAAESLIITPDTLTAQPIRLNLTPFAGQAIVIRLSTWALDNPNYDWSDWVDPQIVYTAW